VNGVPDTMTRRTLGVAGRAVDVLDGVVPAARDALTVLTYHRLDLGPSSFYPGLAGSTPELFEQQMTIVARRCHPVSVHDVLDGGPLPRRAVLVTFDDGYRDFAAVAWPIMARLGIEPVLFVPTAFPDRAGAVFWWDRLYAALHEAGPDARRRCGITGATALEAFRGLRDRVKALPHGDALAHVDGLVDQLGVDPGSVREPVLGWEELRSLAAAGVTVAAHSRTHPLLERLTPAQLCDEVEGCVDDIRREIGPRAGEVFAYPSGSHDDAVRAVVAAAGVRLAFTTRRGVARLGRHDPLRLPRLNVGRRSAPVVVAAQMAAGRRVPVR
jgi:peptidoglycan/xylan/chitin deacetylase (PgdA/CDA1 family)